MESTQSSPLVSLPNCIWHKVFNKLSPKELCHVARVCKSWKELNRDIVGERRWKKLYLSRWPNFYPHPASWAESYSDRVTQSSAFRGRFLHDSLYGHRAAVRSIRILPEDNLLVTGSLDKTIRLWDLDQGIKICRSRTHEGTVRGLALRRVEQGIRLASAAESTIRIWSLSQNPTRLGQPIKLQGHSGPISSLSLTESTLISGSWDCSVCIWGSEGTEWRLKEKFVYPDWIWTAHAKTSRLYLSCGRKLLVQNIESGVQETVFENFLTSGHVSCCTAAEDERYFVTGSTDGVVRLHDPRCNHVAEIAAHSSGITGVSMDDPWVAAGSLDGTISLINLSQKLHPDINVKDARNGSIRQLQCQSGPVYCLDISNQWIACGAENPTVRTWDFRKAVAAAKKAQIDRIVRQNRKNRTPSLPPAQTETTSDASEDDEAPEQLLPSCRVEYRHSRRHAFWSWGDSTDDSEIIDAFG